jgi:hypothetical protein
MVHGVILQNLKIGPRISNADKAFSLPQPEIASKGSKFEQKQVVLRK